MGESGLKKIGVIGIGTMGNGIAQVSAQSGFDTVVMDVDASVLDRGLAPASTPGRSTRPSAPIRTLRGIASSKLLGLLDRSGALAVLSDMPVWDVKSRQ